MDKQTMAVVAGGATAYLSLGIVTRPALAATGPLASHCKYVAPALLTLLAACSQSVPSEKSTPQSPAVAKQMSAVDACALNAQVAIDFVNQYIRHLNDNLVAANPTDTYEWLKSNSLVDPSVASAYSTFDLVDGDPILDAQDYPDKFELSSCPGTSGMIHLQGVGNHDFKVSVKVASVANALKVVGVGAVNMQAETPSAVTSTQTLEPTYITNTLCTSEEKVVFACETKKSKIISLCSSSSLTATDGYLQYRFGNSGKPELTYPTVLSHPSKHFVSGTRSYSGGGADFLQFKSGAYTYTVYEGIGNGWSKDGVAVEKAGQMISDLECSDHTVVGLSLIPDSVIPSDPDNQFEIP